MIMMRNVRLLAVLAVVLFSMSIVSVFAAGYQDSVPIIAATGPAAIGAPPINGAPPLISGTVTFQYADGSPVTLTQSIITLQLCTSGSCVSVDSTFTQVSPGTYSYSYSLPKTLSGPVTITIPSNELADDNGKQFPSVDTVIGSFVAPASTTSESWQPPTQDSGASLPGQMATPNLPQYNPQYNQAAAIPQPASESPMTLIVVALTVLVLTASGLLILPSRKQ
jgi:hypothetical protein